MSWDNGQLSDFAVPITVYQCDVCKCVRRLEHWSYDAGSHTMCGYATEDAAMAAAEDHVIQEGMRIVHAAKKARAHRLGRHTFKSDADK